MSVSKRPRIADVARRAGVSEGTVSVVLNNRVGEQVRVSEETQKKIWDAVRELGYVANPVAQNLAGGQTRIIAVFTFESIFPMDSRNFYYPFLIGIEEEADALGYDLLLVTGSNDPSKGGRHIYQRGVNRLRRADGAILLGHGDYNEVSRLMDEQFPFVFVGRRDAASNRIWYVGADYASATEELIDHLVANGHRRIAYIRSSSDNESNQDREIGVQRAFDRLNLPREEGWLWRSPPETFSADVIDRLIKQGYTAFVAEDDDLRQRVFNAAESLGLACPRDYSLVMLGNPLRLMPDAPQWTSFNIPRREMGREAFKMLIRMLELPVEERAIPQRIFLPCTFKQGNSVRRL